MGRNRREEKQEEMMSMTHRFPAHIPPAVDAAPPIDVVQSDKEARTSGGFTALLESAVQQILAVKYWVDPAPHMGPYPITGRVFGRRLDVKGGLFPGDRVVPGETIEDGIPGGRPRPHPHRGRS